MDQSMNDDRRIWAYSRDNLMKAVKYLGFPEELGEAIVKNLGSPKAMDRMCAYLENVKPQSVELVVDEMLAIRTEIESWKAKKESREASMRYNEMLYYGLGNDDGNDDMEDE